jgi:hypothetical protein
VSRFYDATQLEQVAINLFYGWGYNFYRLENQLRADDQLIRLKAAGLLGQARAALESAEADYRREHLPPPTRDKPFPEPQAVAGAQSLERLGRAIGGLEGQIRHLPVPENDRMSQRYRDEAPTLEALGQWDKRLIGQAELLRVLLSGVTGTAILGNAAEIDDGLAAVAETIRERQELLFR